MKIIQIFIVLCFLITSCKEEIPPPFDKDTMKSILIQVHMTDSALTSLMRAEKDSMAAIYHEQVKAINGLSDEDIEQVFTYLKKHPKYANKLYEEMVVDINKMQQAQNKKDKKKAEKKDKKKDTKKDTKKPK